MTDQNTAATEMLLITLVTPATTTDPATWEIIQDGRTVHGPASMDDCNAWLEAKRRDAQAHNLSVPTGR